MADDASPKQKILWVGDSFSYHSFGERVRSLFDAPELQKQFELNFVAAGGTGPKDWMDRGPKEPPFVSNLLAITPSAAVYDNAKYVKSKSRVTPPISKAVKDIQPDIIVIEQGLNMDYLIHTNANLPALDAYLLAFKRTLLPEGSTKKVRGIWLAPFEVDKSKNKSLKGDPEVLLAALRRVMGPEFTIVDGRHVTSSETNDKANSSDGFHIEDTWSITGPKRYASNYADHFIEKFLKWNEESKNQAPPLVPREALPPENINPLVPAKD